MNPAFRESPSVPDLRGPVVASNVALLERKIRELREENSHLKNSLELIQQECTDLTRSYERRVNERDTLRRENTLLRNRIQFLPGTASIAQRRRGETLPGTASIAQRRRGETARLRSLPSVQHNRAISQNQYDVDYSSSDDYYDRIYIT